MKSLLWKWGLIGLTSALALAPAPVLAHGGEDHGDSKPAAVSPAGVPETQFELKIIDTSQNDPLLGGEVPLEKARVTATLKQGGKSLASESAHAEAIPGVYGVHRTLDANGEYTLTWDVKPPSGQAFHVDFPIRVAGAPDKGTPWLSGWRLPLVILGGIALLLGVFMLGRASGNGKNGHARAVALLLCAGLSAWATGAWAHGGEGHGGPEPAAAAGPVVDLKVGIGDLTTTTQTKTAGKYKVSLTVKVSKPRPPDPNHVRLTDEQVKTLGIQTVTVKGGTFDTGLAVTGSVQPNPASVVTVSSRVPGKLRLVAANIGDRVRAGQALAVVESTEIAEAQGAYAATQSDVLAREAAYRQTQERVRIARRQLSQQQELARAGAFSQAPLQQARTEQANANSELATARADLASAHSQLAQAQADAATHRKALERIQELFDAGIRSKAELEAHQLEAEQDDVRVAQGQALVEQQQARVTQAEERAGIAAQAVAREQKIASTNVLTRKEIVQAQGTLDNARLESEGAMANLQAARRAVSAARSRLAALGVAPGSGNQVTLVAPQGGIVTARSANVGETVLPEKTLFTVLNPSVVWVEGDVFEKDLPRVGDGLPARIAADAVPGRTFAGRISYVAATVDPETRAVRVRVAVANPDGMLRPGMFVRALLVTEARPQTITVPDAAVQEDAGMKVLYVKEGGTYERREVAVGESAGGRTEIKSGVKPGEQVVTVGAYQLKSVGKA
jgi:cobalt-zinc-cadmium efflux system membrane fusion protein